MSDPFVDVDFTRDPNYIRGYHADPLAGVVCRAYEDVAPVYTMAQIRQKAEELDGNGLGIEFLVTRIFDQGQEGACVADAAAQGHEIVQATQNGRDKVIHLSAISLYKRIGRSPGSGAMVEAGLSELRSRGILPLNNAENVARFKHTMPNTGFYTPFPPGWEETAAQLAAEEFLICRSPEENYSAGINGHPRMVGRSGHSICHLRPTMKRGPLAMAYANSWRESWGAAFGYMKGGFGFDSESMVRSASQWCYAIRSVKVPA